MAFPGFAYLLILLLASAPLRDLCPAALASPLQGIGADEDDISLPAPRPDQDQCVPGRGAPPLAEAPSATARLPLLPHAAAAAPAPAHPVSCLYLFMALLR